MTSNHSVIMRILCVDVGRGTQDILLYDSTKTIENCTSLIIPSRGKLLEETLRQAIAAGKTPLFWGGNMGGFPLFPHTPQFLQAGGKILATPAAAKTFHDNLELLVEKGFQLISEPETERLKEKANIAALQTRDIDFDGLTHALLNLGDTAPIDGLAVAVQDHGESGPGISNRQFRFAQHRQMLETCQHLKQLAFKRKQIPPVFTRMQAAAASLPPNIPLLLMDTGWAAILGALEDPVVGSKQRKLVVNIGNAHTLAAYLENERILGLWEHHTRCLDSGKLKQLLDKLVEGTISHEEVFADGGHGAYLKKPPSAEAELIALTGPNRMRFAQEGYYLAAPHGNMMLTGVFGLLRAYQDHFPSGE